MKKCFHYGKKSTKPVLVDTEGDEEIYLCRKCGKDHNKELKNRMNHAKKYSEGEKMNKTIIEFVKKDRKAQILLAIGVICVGYSLIKVMLPLALGLGAFFVFAIYTRRKTVFGSPEEKV